MPIHAKLGWIDDDHVFFSGGFGLCYLLLVKFENYEQIDV